jgi:hypothetical protein
MPPPTASLKPAVAPKAEKADKEKPAKSNKPDQSAYGREQDELNKEIEGVKAQLVGPSVQGTLSSGC